MNRVVFKWILTGGLYLIWAYDLFGGHGSDFSGWDYGYPVNVIAGALGVWSLASRWVRSVPGRWVAGAVYGFGPYALYLMRFHPLAGTLLAVVPWLFCPIFHFDRVTRRLRIKPTQRATRTMLRLLLAILPWTGVIACFQAMVQVRRFVLPLQVTQSPWLDWPALVAPWALASQGRVLLSLYHVPLSLVLVGAMVVFKARRWGPLVCMLLAGLLTLTRGAWAVSPLAWVGVLWVFWAVLAGLGTDALVTAGRSDVRWMVWAPILQVTLAVILLLGACRFFQVHLGLGDNVARLLLHCSRFYLLGAVSLGTLVGITYRGLRWRWLRWLLILGPVGGDLFYSSRFIVDRVL